MDSADSSSFVEKFIIFLRLKISKNQLSKENTWFGTVTWRDRDRTEMNEAAPVRLVAYSPYTPDALGGRGAVPCAA